MVEQNKQARKAEHQKEDALDDEALIAAAAMALASPPKRQKISQSKDRLTTKLPSIRDSEESKKPLAAASS